MNRLDLLRAELARRGVDAFVVPRADQHQGEYVPAGAERLAWLTGFTGSAGCAVVLADRAAVFADGRYTLQAAAEIDASRFEIRHLIDEPPARWLGDSLRLGQKVGIDPWLHTADQVETLRAACARAGAELALLDSNPIDTLWADRPPAPATPVLPHGEEFAGQPAAAKRAEIAAALKLDRLDAAVLSDPASVAWLLNIRGADVPYTPLALAFAIVTAEAEVSLFMQADRLATVVEAAILPPAAFVGALAGLGGKRVRVDRATAAFAIVQSLETAGATVDPGGDPCTLVKACKNAVELDGCRAAHRRDGVAMARFLSWLAETPGVDELTAAARLEELRATGRHFRGLSFPTIAGSGPHGAIVHYRSTEASNRRLRDGELFLLDSGAQYLDGTTDVTRTIAIGTPTAEHRDRFTRVLKGHIALATAIFPVGTTGPQLDVLARRALWAEGLDYDHGTGHGVGSYLSVHEGPQRISKAATAATALRAGMILSNEPGYYRAGAFGIRIENLVAVVPGPSRGERPLLAFETLTLVPIDRVLIDTTLLDGGERAWIDAYHARVLAEIGPLLEPQARDWLNRACAPLE